MCSVYNRALEDGLTAQNTPFQRVYTTGVDYTPNRTSASKKSRRLKSWILTICQYLILQGICSYFFSTSVECRPLTLPTDLSNGFVVYNRHKTGQQMVVKWEQCKYIVNYCMIFAVIKKTIFKNSISFLSRKSLINTAMRITRRK